MALLFELFVQCRADNSWKSRKLRDSNKNRNARDCSRQSDCVFDRFLPSVPNFIDKHFCNNFIYFFCQIMFRFSEIHFPASNLTHWCWCLKPYEFDIHCNMLVFDPLDRKWNDERLRGVNRTAAEWMAILLHSSARWRRGHRVRWHQ